MNTDETTNSDAKTDTVELRIAARAENLALARLALGGVGVVVGAPAEVVADLKLAVTEACTNAIQHAYGGSDGDIVVRYGVSTGAFTIEVEDEGGGFESHLPLQTTFEGLLSRHASGGGVPGQNGHGKGNGMGLMIIRALSDELEVTSTSAGTCVAFRRRFSSED